MGVEEERLLSLLLWIPYVTVGFLCKHVPWRPSFTFMRSPMIPLKIGICMFPEVLSFRRWRQTSLSGRTKMQDAGSKVIPIVTFKIWGFYFLFFMSTQCTSEWLSSLERIWTKQTTSSCLSRRSGIVLPKKWLTFKNQNALRMLLKCS